MLDEMPDNVVIYQSLMMWRNYIETNNVTLSANDAVNMGKPEAVRRLDDVQLRFIDRLEKLANRELERGEKAGGE